MMASALPARRHHRRRPRPDLQRPLRDLPDGAWPAPRSSRSSRRAASTCAGAAWSAARRCRSRCSTPTSARSSLNLKTRKAATAARAGQARRRAGRELRARRDGPARPRRRGAARGQSAADLRAELGLRQVGPYRDYPGDGPHRAGDVRRHEHHRLSRPAAGQGRAGAVRLLRRRASLRRDRHRAVRARAHRHAAGRRGVDARVGLRLARLNLGLSFGSGGRTPPRTGNRHGGLAEAPYNVYPTQDGYIAIICVGERTGSRCSTRWSREDLRADPRFATLKTRVANIDSSTSSSASSPAQFTKQPLFELLMKHRVPCAPVRKLERGRERSAPARARHAAMGRASRARPHRRAPSADALRRRAAMPHQPSRSSAPTTSGVLRDWLGLSRRRRSRSSRARRVI